jgi:hypothetical protein
MAVRTFQDDMNEIRGYFPSIPPNECETVLWRAILDIANENDLAFMIGEAKIRTESTYSTGTVNVTNGLVAITGVATVWVAGWTGRRISIAGSEPYGIALTGAGTANLDTAYLGATAADLKYIIFKDIYTLPADCEFSKEALLYDPLYYQMVDFVDYLEFRRNKSEALTGTVSGIPTEVARIGLTAAGLSQIEFGPLVPNTATTYMLDYYRSPQKPAAITSPVTPIWPEAFEDVKVLRALWKYADKKGHARRFEWEKRYKDRIWLMTTAFDGGNEMRRRMRITHAPSRGGINLAVGNYSKE